MRASRPPGWYTLEVLRIKEVNSFKCTCTCEFVPKARLYWRFRTPLRAQSLLGHVLGLPIHPAGSLLCPPSSRQGWPQNKNEGGQGPRWFALAVVLGRDSVRSSKYPERRGARSLGILLRHGQPVQNCKTSRRRTKATVPSSIRDVPQVETPYPSLGHDSICSCSNGSIRPSNVRKTCIINSFIACPDL